MTTDTDTGFLELVKRRRSCRAYRNDPVPREYIESMIEAARMAPSACNRQPWRFAVMTDAGQRAELLRTGLMPGAGMTWTADAPVLIAMGMVRSVLTHRIAPAFTGVDYPLLDLGIAGEHLVLQAAALGLGACWIGWIRPRGVRKTAQWPGNIKPVSLFTVGWPKEEMPPATSRSDRNEIATWM